MGKQHWPGQRQGIAICRYTITKQTKQSATGIRALWFCSQLPIPLFDIVKNMTPRNDAYFSSFNALPRRPTQAWYSKLLAFCLSSALLVIGLMFSLVALSIVAIAGTLFAGWLWWKTRRFGQAIPDVTPNDSTIIEGEVITRSVSPQAPSQRLE